MPAAPDRRRARGNRLRALGCCALVAAGAGLAADASGALDGLERETLKARFAVRGAEPPADVVVVAIDDRSFADLGRQWPFPRSLHGRAVRRLHAAGARTIVYDVQFTEPTVPREDMALYRAVEAAGGAVLATSESDGHGGTNVLGGEENLARINARAAASDLSNDGSGAVTRFPRAVAGLETLPVAAAERAGGPALPPAAFAADGAWIDFRGPPGTVPAVSFSDVVRGRAAPGALRDKVVVVGATAPTLRDVHATPVGGNELMPGAEVQANAIWTALHGLPLRSAPPAAGLLLVALLALVAPLLRLVLPALAVAAAVPVAAGLTLAGAQLAFGAGVIVGVMGPLAALAVGAVVTISWSHLAESRLRRAVAHDNELLEARVHERTRELRDTQLEIVRRLGTAVEWSDAETGAHIDRIGQLCERLALAIGLGAAEAEALRHASALHDVGKVGIPDRILLKPGPLDREERVQMEAHASIGATILAGSSSELLQLAETIALTHHERWDGTGYPRGLAGEDIPLAGRICAVCDVFDALLCERPYKPAWPLEKVLAELEHMRGGHLDPRLVDAFLPIAADAHRECYSPRRRPRLRVA